MSWLTEMRDRFVDEHVSKTLAQEEALEEARNWKEQGVPVDYASLTGFYEEALEKQRTHQQVADDEARLSSK